MAFRPWPVMCTLALVLGPGIGASQAQQVCEGSGELRSSPTARFEAQADGAVLDKESKLMWMHCSAGQTLQGESCAGTAARHSLASAKAHAESVNREGSFFYTDWRLPTLRELATITERRCSSPRVNLAVFPGTPSQAYWTSSSRSSQDRDQFAFVLGFGTDGVRYVSHDEANLVRLVRRAQ